MGLKMEVENLEGIPEAVRSEYEKLDNGRYRLKVDGVEDVGGLKKKVEELLGEKKNASKKAEEAIAELEKLKLEAAKKGGDTDSIVKSYEDKIATLKGTMEKSLADMQAHIARITAEETGTKIAAELARQVKGADGKMYSTVDALEPLIKSRLRADVREGKYVVVVLDKNGNPTADKIEDLKNEFINNPAFSPLITGSKASGAGDQGAGSAGGMAGDDMMKLSPIERMKAARAAKK